MKYFAVFFSSASFSRHLSFVCGGILFVFRMSNPLLFSIFVFWVYFRKLIEKNVIVQFFSWSRLIGLKFSNMEASQIMEILLRILTLGRSTSEFRLFWFLPFIVCVILFYNTFYFRRMTGLSGIVEAPQIAAVSASRVG